MCNTIATIIIIEIEHVDERDPFGKKYGKKKLAKLQAKADARAEREAVSVDTCC